MSGLPKQSGSLAVLAILTFLSTTVWAEDSKKTPETQHIVGGQPVEPEEFPFVVLIDGGDWVCTGSIIAPDWILTAAHCVVEGDGSVIHPTGVAVERGYPHHYEKRKAIRVMPHPEYEYGGTGFVNDVARIRIVESFD